MAVGSEVVDISVDPLDERRRRGRAWLRLGIPIGGVALMVGVILAIALYSERANRAEALALSEDLLSALDDRIAMAVSSYLDPATRAVAIARDVVKEGSITARLPVIETFGASLLRQIPQIAILSFADEEGNYVMVRRVAAGGTDTKVVQNAPGPRRVIWIHRDAAGIEMGREEDPDDQFDPRTRPWYIGAAASDDLFWTGVLTVAINLIMASAFASILIYAMDLLPHRIGLIGGLFYGLNFGLGGSQPRCWASWRTATGSRRSTVSAPFCPWRD